MLKKPPFHPQLVAAFVAARGAYKMSATVTTLAFAIAHDLAFVALHWRELFASIGAQPPRTKLWLLTILLATVVGRSLHHA